MWGWLVSGKNADLVACLLTSVMTSESISGNEIARNMSMNVWDVTANRGKLTINDKSFTEPSSEDATLRPHTEQDAHINQNLA